jgi:hypothetical protein
MKISDSASIREVSLPFSDGLMSAKVWTAGERSVVLVPELGLFCYGKNDAQAAFRLFTTLLKYYRQLRAHKERLGERGLQHLEVLAGWVRAIETRMTEGSTISDRLTSRIIGRHSNLIEFSRKK